MYFENIPKIFYDSMNIGRPKVVTNLLRRVSVRANIKANTLLFDTYTIKEGETPEIIAHKLYNDPELHWVILLINDIIDRYHQWPMNFSQFNQFIADKYDNVDDIHHYEFTQLSGKQNVKIEVYNNSALYNGDKDFYSTAVAITNREHEEIQQNIKRQIRLLDPVYIEEFKEEYINLINETSI
jgi:hypothetical protein|tara:strand:- start:56 stop:604 length:549 start_codon:yes stop_codon:yes gene_type:complete